MAKEEKAAFGRMARTDVVGLRSMGEAPNYAAIEDLAVKRLVTQGLTNPTGADMAYGAMVKCLQDARLTISLKCSNWFYNENKSKEYTTFFAGRKSGASNDMIKRDGAEKTMFGYEDGGGGTPSAVDVAKARVQQYGQLNSPDFQGAMRPRYSAADFAFCNNGGLTKYGKSFFVLKEHCKHNATFCHCDSFEVDNDMIARKDEYGRVPTLDNVLATCHELGKIIYYCHPAVLKKIHAYGTGKQARGSENELLGGNIYIEAQVHADIVFARDIESINISNSERVNGPSIHPLWNANMLKKKSTWDASDAAKVEKHARSFAARNNITYTAVV